MYIVIIVFYLIVYIFHPCNNFGMFKDICKWDLLPLTCSISPIMLNIKLKTHYAHSVKAKRFILIKDIIYILVMPTCLLNQTTDGNI